MTGLTNHDFNKAATAMTVAAKTSLAALNMMRVEQRYTQPEAWDLQASGETAYIMDVMIEHLRDFTQQPAEVHNRWAHTAWSLGISFGVKYVPGEAHPKAVEWVALSVPAKIELNVIRGIVNGIVLSIVDLSVIKDYIAALDDHTDAFMARTVN